MEKRSAANRQDLSRLVTDPPTTTETYWQAAAEQAAGLGTHTTMLPKPRVQAHVDRLRMIEQTYGGAIPGLMQDPQHLRRQLKVSPKEELEVNVVDLNTGFLLAASDRVQAHLSKQGRRSTSAEAFARLGGLNRSRDLGIYLGPLVTAMSMRDVSQDVLDEAQNDDGMLERESISYLLTLADEYDSGQFVSSGSNHNYFMRQIWHNSHMPGSASFTTSALMRIGEYFTDYEQHAGLQKPVDSNTAVRLAESSLRVAREALTYAQERGWTGINKLITFQMIRRYHDVAALDLYRRLKTGEIEYSHAEDEHTFLMRSYIADAEKWIATAPSEEGLTFEWLGVLIVRDWLHRTKQLDKGYIRYGTPDEDYPEDELHGGATNNLHAIDNVVWRNGQWHFLQHKIKSSGQYAHPIVTVDSRPYVELDPDRHNDAVPKSMLPYFKDTLDEIKRHYTKIDAPESPLAREFGELLVGRALGIAA